MVIISIDVLVTIFRIFSSKGSKLPNYSPPDRNTLSLARFIKTYGTLIGFKVSILCIVGTVTKAKNALIQLLETIPENLLSDSETECEDNNASDDGETEIEEDFIHVFHSNVEEQ